MENTLTTKKKRKSRSCQRPNPLQDGQVQLTPPERLHSVEEFMTKLEQAVLERL